MPVKLTLREQEYEAQAGKTLLKTLKEIEIQPQSVIATKEGELITEDEILIDGDKIKLITVISGGQI
jgi:sulfur carrier protein ThiS